MVVVPLAKPAIEPQSAPSAETTTSMPWARIAAAGTLLAGGALLLNGKRQAGVAVAAAGTALALLEQQEMIRSWWNQLPGYLEEAQQLLGHVQGAVDELAFQQQKLTKILSR